jgi:DNA-binding NtrC family response regulator
LPALREHRTDIPLLVRQFARQQSVRDSAEHALDEELVRRWMQRPWPGNVRQLRNVAEQAVAFGIEEVPAPETPREPVAIDVPFKSAKAKIVSAFELAYLTAILARNHGNITASANAAELDRVHFLRLLDRYGLRKTKVSSRPPKRG